MGKGKGKKGRKDDKKKVREPKIKGLPKAPNPTKIANKLAAKQKREARLAELKAAIAADPSLLKPFPTPMQRTEPFMKNPNAAKWPALFKRQIGLIEMHIESLDRIMSSMKSDADTMSENDRLDWELGERGNWRAICGMMDRARLVLSQTKEAAQGVLPPDRLRDKPRHGVQGTVFEPLVPKLDQKAKELGYDPKGRGSLGRSMDYLDKDGDSEMSDAADSSADSDSDDGVTEGADFVSLNVGKKAPRFGEESSSDKENKATSNMVDVNPYFVVDIAPTPLNLSAPPPSENKPNDGLSNRKRRKLEREKLKEERLAKRMAKKADYEAKKAAAAAAAAAAAEATKAEPQSPAVDFKALEAKLQAEIEDGTKAQQEEKAQEVEASEKKSKKKRRRSSEGGEVVEKKVKKEKKRRVEDSEDVEEEDNSKKEKKTKKEKKRKADDAVEVDEIESGKKKKRKHKVQSDSE